MSQILGLHIYTHMNASGCCFEVRQCRLFLCALLMMGVVPCPKWWWVGTIFITELMVELVLLWMFSWLLRVAIVRGTRAWDSCWWNPGRIGEIMP